MTCGLLLLVVERALVEEEEREEAEAGLGVGSVDDEEVVVVLEGLVGVEVEGVWRFVGGIFLFLFLWGWDWEWVREGRRRG